MPISAILSFDDLIEYKKYTVVCIDLGVVPLPVVSWLEEYKPATVERPQKLSAPSA
jgi:hypothetical protein